MALESIPTKKTGDELTATEFNAVVEAIRQNADDVAAATNERKEMKTTMAKLQDTQVEQQATMAKLPPMVALTQEEYDALVAAGTVEEGTYYNIMED